MICFAFPLAHEAKELLKDCTRKESFAIGQLQCTLGNLGDRSVLIAQVGMGQTLAEENTRVIFHYFRPRAVVLAGYGGALSPQLKAGQIIMSNNYTSEEVLPFLRLLTGFDFAGFCTSDELADTKKKRDEYAQNSRSQVIEMETAAVADVVHARSIPFIALRVISDDYQQVLPAKALAAGFNARKGRATPFRLLAHLAMHPGDISPFRKFVSGLSPARRNLTNFLRQLNDELPRGW
jgi:adenosylhomocysteine nucleosidase